MEDKEFRKSGARKRKSFKYEIETLKEMIKKELKKKKISHGEKSLTKM